MEPPIGVLGNDKHIRQPANKINTGGCNWQPPDGQFFKFFIKNTNEEKYL